MTQRLVMEQFMWLCKMRLWKKILQAAAAAAALNNNCLTLIDVVVHWTAIIGVLERFILVSLFVRDWILYILSFGDFQSSWQCRQCPITSYGRDKVLKEINWLISACDTMMQYLPDSITMNRQAKTITDPYPDSL